jgi:tRNA nucleotidyltransferase (CCA-adding enzyme)
MEFLQLFSQPVNPLAYGICSILQEVGHQAYIVGGCVRDLHMGLVPKDWDICTDASPEEVVSLFSKTIPTGIKHGTVTVCMPASDGTEHYFEVTTFRVEGEYLDGRRPEEVKFVKNIVEDLARRDLTINAIAYNPITQMVCDPFGGFQDIGSKIIRTVGDPNARFQEDGLRIMRAARFAARFGYTVEQATLEGMAANLEILKLVSAERIKDELWKTLAATKPSIGFDLLGRCGVLSQIEKEWTGKTFNITMGDLDQVPQAEIETKFAMLCSSFAVFVFDRLSEKLKLSNNEIKKIKFLLEALDQFAVYLRNQNAHQARVFLAYVKNKGPDVNSLREFLYFSDAIGLEARQDLEKYQDEIVWARSEMQINGNDLIQLNVKPGPAMKKLLDDCYQEILREPKHNNKEYLLKFIMFSL